MKAGPKEQMQRQLGPTGIERQLGSSLKASYTARKPVTTVTKLQQSVTRVTNKSVTANNSVTLKRGRKPKGEAAQSQAERAKAYRARKKTTS
jgi:hypothetical protein